MFKFKKKSLLALALSCTLALSVFGCGKKADSDKTAEQATTEVTASETDPATPDALAEQEKFNEWLWESFEESVTNDTLTLHYSLAHPEEYDIIPSEVTYGDDDISEEASKEDKKETEESLAEMEDFNYELLTYDQRFTYDILRDKLLTDLESYDFLYLYEPWTLEDTQKYLTDSGFNGDVAQELMDYVIAEPVNYQMYVLGWLEFEELRLYAEDSLGSKFDEVAFHKVVLDAGPCQFYILKTKVDQYVNSAK